MGGSSRSKSNQTAEGDLVFNNVDYGGQGAGAGPLKNFNVGRGNKLVDNNFNVSVTDGGATRSALAAGVAMANAANETVRKGASYALGSNEAIAKNAMNNTTATAFKGLDTAVDLAKVNERVTGKALDEVTKTSSEAIKASKAAQDKAYGFASASTYRIAALARDSQDSAYSLSKNAISTYEDLVATTGSQVTDAQVSSAQATNKALDYVFQSSKTATERQSENLIKYGTWGAIGIVGAIALTSLAR